MSWNFAGIQRERRLLARRHGGKGMPDSAKERSMAVVADFTKGASISRVPTNTSGMHALRKAR